MSLDVEESTRRPCEGRRVSSCLWRVCATTEGASPGLQTAAGPDRRHTALPPNRDNLAKIPYAMEATTPHHAAPSDTSVLNIFSRMAMILYYSLCLLPTWPVCVCLDSFGRVFLFCCRAVSCFWAAAAASSF